MTRKAVSISFRLYALAILYFWCSVVAKGQFNPIVPNCCSQAIQLTADNAKLQLKVQEITGKYEFAKAVRDSTVAVDGRIIAALEDRLSHALKSGNMAVSEVSRYRAELTALGLRGWNPFFNRRKWARRVLGR